MKTTFDLPEPLLRRATAVAALRGSSLRDLVAEAMAAKLAADEAASQTPSPARRDVETFKAALIPRSPTAPPGSRRNCGAKAAPATSSTRSSPRRRFEIGCPVVTHDVRHFDSIDGLTVVDWLAADG